MSASAKLRVGQQKGSGSNSVQVLVKPEDTMELGVDSSSQDGSTSSSSNGSQNGSDVSNSKPELLFGIRTESLTPQNQFLFCVGGILFCFMIYGYVQEAIFRIDGMKPHALYLTLVQFLLYSVFSKLEMVLQAQTRKIPLWTYVFLAVLTLATMALSNTSLAYLNYPTQVIFKSCKLIPVMIGSMIIVGRQYKAIDISAVLLMCAGLAWFTLADSSVYPEFNHTGIVLIMLALCADALIGNYQEKAMKEFNAGNTEVVLYSYSLGFVYLLVGLVVAGVLTPSFTYFTEDPGPKYGLAFAYALSGYLGIKFVLTSIKLFGALVAVTITTLRKALTMTLSFLLFSKPFTIQYLWSGLIILIGIGLNVYSKNRSKIDPWLQHQLLTWKHSSRRPSPEVQAV